MLLLPLAIAQPPRELPTAGAIGSLLLLALVGTALAQLILFRVIELFGARRLSLVTYLMPGFALVYGALILDEQITAAALGGLALILVGVALGSGALRLRRPAAERGAGRLVEATLDLPRRPRRRRRRSEATRRRQRRPRKRPLQGFSRSGIAARRFPTCGQAQVRMRQAVSAGQPRRRSETARWRSIRVSSASASAASPS